MPVKKGDFLTGGGYPAIAKRADDRLRAEFPMLQDVIEAAGPVPSPARLREIAAERERVAQRLEALKRRIEELRAENRK